VGGELLFAVVGCKVVGVLVTGEDTQGLTMSIMQSITYDHSIFDHSLNKSPTQSIIVGVGKEKQSSASC
jgi:hypothetical protein